MDLTYGILGVLLGVILNGSFVAPMKKLHKWRWENSWLVYSISGLLIIPWIAALTTVPKLGEVLAGASSGALWRVALFGLGWGVGSVLFGLGIARMGLAVGYGLILGLIAPIGTFLPLVTLHPEQLGTARGVSLIVGAGVVVGGIVLCAAAEKMREHGQAAAPRQGFAVSSIAYTPASSRSRPNSAPSQIRHRLAGYVGFYSFDGSPPTEAGRPRADADLPSSAQ